MAKLRSELAPAEHSAKSAAACGHAAEWLRSRQASCVMLYMPFRSELDTKPLIEWCLKEGVVVILPRVHPSDRSMALYRLDGWEGLAPGAYGIMEPDPERCVPFDAHDRIDVVFAPGLAFDKKGGRLGYGGGYYDRFAANGSGYSVPPPRKACWLGVAYELQLVEDLPMQEHDKRMDGIVTENGIMFFNQQAL